MDAKLASVFSVVWRTGTRMVIIDNVSCYPHIQLAWIMEFCNIISVAFCKLLVICTGCWSFSVIRWAFFLNRWMIGEAHDHDFPDEPPISLQNTNDCGRMLEAALIWSLAYYFIILPCELIPCNKASLVEYDDGRLKPPICLSSFFKTFRRYENVHMLFWIAKDLAWNRESLVIWLLCLVPTLAIAVNFLWIAATTPSDVWFLFSKYHHHS